MPMNEDIYLLLDGDLSDTDSALLFRQLSESSAERVAFRQQLRLQSALNKNEQFQGLTAQEDAALLTQLGSSVGLQPSATPVIAAQHADSVPASTAALTGATGWFSRRGVTMLFAGLVLGGWAWGHCRASFLCRPAAASHHGCNAGTAIASPRCQRNQPRLPYHRPARLASD
ncbi:MAG: hypothetical protein UZ07_CHB004000856 [Chlorobi bacterium OLB7]|nr:MAG: hypothetical protein UZ07_CHB004000856 [Chlorobi bacterium OLB7]